MKLRMVEMVVSANAKGRITAMADEWDALDTAVRSLDDERVLLRLLVPGEKTEGVIHSLEEAFRVDPAFRIVILEVQATLPAPAEEKTAPAETEEAAEAPPPDTKRIAVAELVQQASDSAVVNRTFIATVVLSTIVASIGLVRDNVAVIIGAMVIAPLLTPNMTLALATTLGDPALARKALRVNGTGIGLALALATLAGVAIPVDLSVPEIANRTVVSLSDIALALAAGSAGALALTTGLSAAVVGVMVAVALLPPLVTFGLLLGSGQVGDAANALLLTTVNIVCVNLAGVGTFLWQKINPRFWWEAERAKRMVRKAGAVWLVLLGVLGLLIMLSA